MGINEIAPSNDADLILYHLEMEPEETATCKELLQVRQEGSHKVKRSLKSYALEVEIDTPLAEVSP